MIKWIVTNIRMLLLAGAMLSVMAIGLYMTAFQHGKNSVVNKIQTKTIEKIETQKQLEYVIMTKPKVEVQNELEKKWCRDCQ
tara:strand:- start:5980 stop:6225 length:246 start_codon:yes stop_codon:yes gene_type:complete